MENSFAKKISDFLAIANPTDRQVVEGATLLLQCNPNRERGIYNTALRRPQAALPWVRSDLRKYLGIHERGLTTADVERYNRETLRRVEQTLAQIPDGSAAPTPQRGDMGGPHAKTGAASNEGIGLVPILGTRGKRPDHDALPDDVRALWEKNRDRWQQMRRYHAQLAQMTAQPGYAACDGNELCYQLRRLDDALRHDYELYDNFKPHSAAVPERLRVGDGTSGMASASGKDYVDVFTDNVRTIQNARTALSRGLARKTPHTPESLRRLQEATDTLFALKQTIKPETMEKLKAVGISIQQTDNYAKG